MKVQSLDDYRYKGHANALIVKFSIWVIRDHPNPHVRQKFKHGVRPKKDSIVWFPRFCEATDQKTVDGRTSYEVYENKFRANFHGEKDENGKVKEWTRRMGKHDILVDVGDGKKDYRVHYFPLVLDDEDLIKHDGCLNCKKP